MSLFHLPRRVFQLGALAVALGAGAVQAQDLPSKDIPVTPSQVPSVPADSITVNTTLTKDFIWTLKGFVIVKSGVTLTIEPGTTIVGHPTIKGTLLVDRGGYLVAAGTAAAPITFKGPSDDRGQWGGLVLLGKGYSNQSVGGSLLEYEALEWALYAGTNDEDSSGVLTYVRLVNPGFAIFPDRELNGLTLCAVGKKTVIHHIQVHRGDDDGIEWFGGTVSTSHLVVTNAVDDSYDTDNGYTGNSEFMIAIQSAEPPRPRPNPAYPNGEAVGDRGLECGSSGGAPGRYTNPVWKNITFIENGISGGAMEFKEECGGTYENMVLVAGGVTQDSAAWVMNFVSPRTVNGIVDIPPHVDFKNAFITGKYRKKYNISGTADQIENATALLDQNIKAYDYSSINSYGLYQDLTPSHPEIIGASAGAIVGNNLWYQGWTLPGTVTFPLGDTYNLTAPTVTLVSDPATLPYAPATFTLNATATDPDGIALLEILKEGNVVASSPTGSVSYIVSGAAKGANVFSVRATDNHKVKKSTTQEFGFVVQFQPNAAAPVVTLTRTGDATLFAPAAFTLNAGAVDADGIATLEILKGSDVIASNTGSGTLAFNLTGLAEGSHVYTVRAKDTHSDDPKTTTFDLLVEIKANLAPEVTLTRTGDNLISPAAFSLIATATDADGAIASLQILQGSDVLGTAAAGALTVPLNDKAAGTYVFTVKATDNNPVNPKTVTKELTVFVSEPPTIENASAPAITLVRGDDKTLIAPASFKLFASAGDADGIDTLEVLLDGVVVATGTSASLEVSITAKGAGTHNYTARAKDKHPTNPKADTKSLVVEVAAPVPNDVPTLSLTRTGADTLRALADFSLFAQAADADGIDTVQILFNGQVIGTSTNGALLVQVEDKIPGTYTYTARAKDKHATDSKVITKDLVVIVREAPVTLAKPIRDLEEITFSASRGQNLVLRSAGYGLVRVSVWTLSGRKVGVRDVNLVQGENAIRMGNLRGVHIVRLSTGAKSRSTRVVFSAGQ